MKLNAIFKVKNVDELRSLGSYYETKRYIESELNIKLGVSGWNSLYDKISAINDFIRSFKKNITSIYEGKTFTESKKYISKILKIKIKTRSWNALEWTLTNIITLVKTKPFDPHEYYENNKMKKFCDSSRLEGIELTIPDESTSLQSVLEEYRNR
ncbi:hypothetical protein [Xenorhabdus szentirmaii]|uniref:hypothetical protein n=1 Tax=Xenorhabdus szentirmaii TaxID=290112 RepID=UPI00198EA464|nr:hypothetical protein [Xenorhabdus sp. 38]MBD2779520.1 hypothetical protein [Xenorhabdus sp. 38]